MTEDGIPYVASSYSNLTVSKRFAIRGKVCFADQRAAVPLDFPAKFND